MELNQDSNKYPFNKIWSQEKSNVWSLSYLYRLNTLYKKRQTEQMWLDYYKEKQREFVKENNYYSRKLNFLTRGIEFSIKDLDYKIAYEESLVVKRKEEKLEAFKLAKEERKEIQKQERIKNYKNNKNKNLKSK